MYLIKKTFPRKIRKIVLVETRSPDYHVYSRYPLPRLGTVLLGTILKEAGYDVKIFVENISPLKLDELFDADLVGISTITSTVQRGYELSKLLKTENIPVLMGGPHVTFMPDEALQFCDFVIRGEADDVILYFVRALEENNGNFERIPGLSFNLEGKIVHNPGFFRCESLDSLPIPDFHLISGYKNLPVYPVMTSRGCPYDCKFCSVTQLFGRKYRFKSPLKILQEIRATNSDWIFFYDDNFTASPARTKELLRLMLKNNITPHWTAQVRTDVVRDKELLSLMKDTNCYALYIGIESINPETLQYYNKKQTLDEIKMCIDSLHDNGIKVHGMFVLGSDHDTVEVIRETVKFARSYNIDTVQFMILTPLPGTLLFEQLEREKRILTKAWYLYDGHHVVYRPKNMTPFHLQVETLKAMKKFYSFTQVLKNFFSFQLYTFIITITARRIIRQWKRRNRYYINLCKNFTENVGRKLEEMAKTLSYDLWSELTKIYRKAQRALLKKIRKEQKYFQKTA